MGRKHSNAGRRTQPTSAESLQHLAGPRRRPEPVIHIGRRACDACGLALPEDWRHDLHASCWRKQHDTDTHERTSA